jgi:hypothetical protein
MTCNRALQLNPRLIVCRMAELEEAEAPEATGQR